MIVIVGIEFVPGFFNADSRRFQKEAAVPPVSDAPAVSIHAAIPAADVVAPGPEG